MIELPPLHLPPLEPIGPLGVIKGNIDDPFDDFSPPRSQSVGGSRPNLWDVTLTGVILNPVSIMDKVLSDTLSAWNGAIPGESSFDGVIDSVLSSLNRETAQPASIESAIQGLFNGVQSVINGMQASVDAITGSIAPISVALNSFFDGLQKFPQDGDYVYNDTLGISYTIFEKRATRPEGTADPTANLIFRVQFSVTLNDGLPNEVTKNFVAMTLFPTPEIGELLTTLFNYALGLVKVALAAGVSSVVTAVVAGVINGLSSLYTELLALIEAIEIPTFDPGYLETAISEIQDAASALTDRVDALELAQDALQTALDALQAVIDGSATVTVIGSDGNYHTIKVQEDTTGGSAEREITWIDSSSGEGKRASFLIKSGAAAPVSNTVDVDWRQIDYIHPSGTTYQMHCLVKIVNGEPVDNADWPNYTVTDITIVKSDNTTEDRQALTLPDGAIT